MPDVRCPTCDAWSPRRGWATAPGEPFPFRIVCPGCGAVADVAEVGYRLGAGESVGRTCNRCPAPLPAADDPVYDDWTLLPQSREVACPRCIRLTELAERIGWERARAYKWRESTRGG